MNIFFIINAVILGFIIGSFLNVVSLRYGTGKSLQGRSMCMSCGKTLSWYELIPVFSWLSQKGRCRSCSSRIPFELLASELITGLFFGLIAARGFFLKKDIDFLMSQPYLMATLYLFLIFSVLIVILFYDMRHKIIPDSFSFIFTFLAFLSMFFFKFENGVFLASPFHLPSLTHFLAGILIPLPFALIWLFSKGRLIGLGDPKLMLGIGFLLGLTKGFSAIFLAFWIGALFALALWLINIIFHKNLVKQGKKSIMKTEVPFAPFLIIGTLIVLLWNVNVLII